MKTIIIDNYDSFTFNLYQMVATINRQEPLVIRNDHVTWAEVKRLEYDNIILSPGPGRPENSCDFGICRDALLDARVPVLGVCLGHQGLGYLYGGSIIHAPEVMHGRQSDIYHDNSALFSGIPQRFTAVRYHSLIVADDLPGCLVKTAWTHDGIIMGVRHRQLPLWGVQFHPESICTEYGYRLLANFHTITAHFGQPNPGHRSWPGFSVIPQRRDVRRQCLPEQFQVCSRKLETSYDPERVFVHLFGKQPFAFWLDSSRVEVGLSRFSFMGDSSGPYSSIIQYSSARQELAITEGNQTLHLTESIFSYLKRKIHQRSCRSDALPFAFNCGFVGYLGYELQRECGGPSGHVSTLPDACFLFSDRLIAFDHQEETTYLVCFVEKHTTALAEVWFDHIERQLKNLPPLDEVAYTIHPQPITFRLAQPYEAYLKAIRQCQHYIREGETYEVCLTNQISADLSLDQLTLYRTLRHVNPAPYAAFLRFGDIAVLCSSPERFLQIDREGWVESKPIKGTIQRGRTAQEDEAFRCLLHTSQKNRSENLMIVDLLRNDLGTVCDIGSVNVPSLMHVETYQTVHQLVSTIRAHLREDLDPIDCIQKAFPGGSMTGAPKIRTMEIIKELEQRARQIYSGSIGFLGLNGTADLNIVIRTIVMARGSTTMGVGGAIVALSDAEEEFNEILLKARALIQAIMLLARGEHMDSYTQIEHQVRLNNLAGL